MDLTLGPEETAVRDAIRGVLTERLPLARVRAVASAEPGIDEALWREAGGLGWFGLGLPEDAGGAGYGAAEEMLLFVELGRGLTPGQWLGTVLGAHALAGTPALAPLLAGELRVALIDDPSDALGDGARLAGVARGVADAGAAGGFLVLGGGAARYLPATTHGLAVEGRPSIDPTRRLGDVRFSGIAASPLASDTATLRTLATLLAAAEAVGVAERALEDSVEYAKVRQQFGRPIGSFQAVKHRCADMAVRAEVALAHHLRGGGARRGRGNRAPPRRRRQGARDRRRARQRGRQRPEPRRHGFHVGSGRAPLSQARLAPRARPRDAHRAPGRARRPLAGGVSESRIATRLNPL